MRHESSAVFFSLDGKLTVSQVSGILDGLRKRQAEAAFDLYTNFPAIKLGLTRNYTLTRIEEGAKDKKVVFLYEEIKGAPLLFKAIINPWDEEHFGYKTANLSLEYCENVSIDLQSISRLMYRFSEILRKKMVRFVNFRVHGDNIKASHAAQENDFLYYETIIFPVHKCDRASQATATGVRLMQESDFDRVMAIAKEHQFQRSHFHLDDHFDKDAVNAISAKWVQTAWGNGEPIAVIEHESELVGYFILTNNEKLTQALGYQYYGMRFLALDTSFRGLHLGSNLFAGAVILLRNFGAEYIESGYPSRNHQSARLHDKNGFHSISEAITLHY